MSEPRAYTQAEVREKFLAKAAATALYWATVENPGRATGESEMEARTTGAIFSMLVALDGGTMDLPGFKISPAPHESDEEYSRDEGENWFPSDLEDLGGALHEEFHAAVVKAKERMRK